MSRARAWTVFGVVVLALLISSLRSHSHMLWWMDGMWLIGVLTGWLMRQVTRG